jgi:hypothetical protein
MSYDYGASHISHFTGLTGIEARNIAHQLAESAPKRRMKRGLRR